MTVYFALFIRKTLRVYGIEPSLLGAEEKN